MWAKEIVKLSPYLRNIGFCINFISFSDMSCVYAFWELKICGINDGPPAENRPLSVEKMQNFKNERSEKALPTPHNPT